MLWLTTSQDTFNTAGQLLSYYQFSFSMTVDKCASICSSRNYAYMGLSNGQYCYCDNQLNLYNGLAYQTSADKCAVPCGGDSSQNCGSFWTNAMFMLTTKYQAAQDAAASSSRASAARSVSRPELRNVELT